MWFKVLFKRRSLLETNNPYELLHNAQEIFEWHGKGDELGLKCLKKAMEYAPTVENPAGVYRELTTAFLNAAEDDLMIECDKKAELLDPCEDELFYENGKLKRRKKTSS